MIVAMSWRAAAMRASSVRPTIRGTIRAARIPRIVITTMISISVNPRATRDTRLDCLCGVCLRFIGGRLKKLDLISTNAPKALKFKRFFKVRMRGEDNIALGSRLDREIGGVSPPLGGIRYGLGRNAPRVTLGARTPARDLRAPSLSQSVGVLVEVG